MEETMQAAQAAQEIATEAGNDLGRLVLTILAYLIPLLLGWLAVRVFNTMTERLEKRRPDLKGNLGLAVLKSVVTAVIWVTAIVASLSNNRDFTRLWATVVTSASVAGVVLGLAAQETLGNVFSGISMSIGGSKPFSIGDWVKVGDADAGAVQNVTLRHVEIRTYLGEHIFIPNSEVARSRVINFTARKGFTNWIEMSVAYESDHRKAMEVMQEVVRKHPKYYGDGMPMVQCTQAGDSGVTLRVAMTTEAFGDNLVSCSDCRVEIMKQFKTSGIEIPYNKLEVLRNEVTLTDRREVR